MPGGNPGKYTTERVEKITNAIINLKGRVGATREAGINYDTFCEWMNHKPEFSEAVKRAEAEAGDKGKEIAIMSIFNAMPKQWQAGAWWLERNYKDQYAARSEVTGKEGGAVEVENKLSPEQEKRLTEGMTQLVEQTMKFRLNREP